MENLLGVWKIIFDPVVMGNVTKDHFTDLMGSLWGPLFDISIVLGILLLVIISLIEITEYINEHSQYNNVKEIDNITILIIHLGISIGISVLLTLAGTVVLWIFCGLLVIFGFIVFIPLAFLAATVIPAALIKNRKIIWFSIKTKVLK